MLSFIFFCAYCAHLDLHVWIGRERLRCIRDGHVIVCGIPTVKRAVIQTLDSKDAKVPGAKRYQLFVEGTGLQEVMATSGVRGCEARCVCVRSLIPI